MGAPSLLSWGGRSPGASAATQTTAVDQGFLLHEAGRSSTLWAGLQLPKLWAALPVLLVGPGAGRIPAFPDAAAPSRSMAADLHSMEQAGSGDKQESHPFNLVGRELCRCNCSCSFRHRTWASLHPQRPRKPPQHSQQAQICLLSLPGLSPLQILALTGAEPRHCHCLAGYACAWGTALLPFPLRN